MDLWCYSLAEGRQGWQVAAGMLEAWHEIGLWRWFHHPEQCGSGGLPGRASWAVEVAGLMRWCFWTDWRACCPLMVEQELDAGWTAAAFQLQPLACSWVWWLLLEVQVEAEQAGGVALSGEEGGEEEGAGIYR